MPSPRASPRGTACNQQRDNITARFPHEISPIRRSEQHLRLASGLSSPNRSKLYDDLDVRGSYHLRTRKTTGESRMFSALTSPSHSKATEDTFDSHIQGGKFFSRGPQAFKHQGENCSPGPAVYSPRIDSTRGSSPVTRIAKPAQMKPRLSFRKDESPGPIYSPRYSIISSKK